MEIGRRLGRRDDREVVRECGVERVGDARRGRPALDVDADDVAESLALLRWSRRRRAATGIETLIGRTAVVSSPTQVRVAGELWEAVSDVPLVPGESVQVTGVDGLTLRVSPRSRAPR